MHGKARGANQMSVFGHKCSIAIQSNGKTAEHCTGLTIVRLRAERRPVFVPNGRVTETIGIARLKATHLDKVND